MALTPTRRLELWTRGLVVVLTAASLALIWSVFIASTLGERDETQALQAERIQRSAGAFASGFNHVVGDSRLSLDLLTQQVASHSGLDALHSREFLSLVEVVRNRSRNLIDIRGVTLEGNRVLFGLPPDDPPLSVLDRPYFQNQVPYPGVGFFIDAPVVSRADGQRLLILSQAVPPHKGSLAVLYIALEFSHLDSIVEALSDATKETVTLYRTDGVLLYSHPLPSNFPADSGRIMDQIRTSGQQSGLLGGEDLRAFQKVEDAPVWVVVSRPPSTVAAEWERTFLSQLGWVSVLTAALLGSMALLLGMLRQLRAIRLKHEELARIDPLTGLLNRRAFLERSELERTRAQRHAEPLCLLLLDLDHFKQVNDKFGHQEGDRVLKDFAAVLVRVLRSTDALARTGGEEFAVLLPSTSLGSGKETAERLRQEVETIALPQGRQTTSLGLSLWDGAESFDPWYQRTDQALYRAKTGGRNRLETAD